MEPKKIFFILILFSACKYAEKKKDQENAKDSVEVNAVRDTFNYMDFSYNKVIAFATIDPFVFMKMDSGKIVFQRGKTDTISVTLDSIQIQKLNTVLSGKTTTADTENLPADCFYPRHNIIFTDENNNIIHYMSVCFECGNLRSSKISKAKWNDLVDFFNEVGLKVFDRPDEYGTYYNSRN